MRPLARPGLVAGLAALLTVGSGAVTAFAVEPEAPPVTPPVVDAPIAEPPPVPVPVVDAPPAPAPAVEAPVLPAPTSVTEPAPVVEPKPPPAPEAEGPPSAPVQASGPTSPAPAATQGKTAPQEGTRHGRKASSAEGRAQTSSHGGFDECHGAPDVDACQAELSQRFDEQEAACPTRVDQTPECIEATENFERARICAAEADRAACEAEVNQNPCWQSPNSGACIAFIDANRDRICPVEDETPSFECKLAGAARSLYCGPGGGLASNDEERCPSGGGSEEGSSPGERAAPGGGAGGDTVRVGLTDPGARGDVALASISRGDGDGDTRRVSDGTDAGDERPLARTGSDSWPVVLAGMLLLAAGLLLRGRPRARSRPT